MIYAKGRVDSDGASRKLDLTGSAVPLRQAGRIVESVPIVGKVVSRFQKTITGANFRAVGPAEDPQVSFSVLGSPLEFLAEQFPTLSVKK